MQANKYREHVTNYTWTSGQTYASGTGYWCAIEEVSASGSEGTLAAPTNEVQVTLSFRGRPSFNFTDIFVHDDTSAVYFIEGITQTSDRRETIVDCVKSEERSVTLT